MNFLAAGLILAGLFFFTVSCVGMLRLPDFYSRAHAVGKSETLGAILILAGLAVYNGLAISSSKLVLILVFVLLTTPAAIHALTRAALISGLEPWTKKEPKGPVSSSPSSGSASGEDD